jgi:hypothetical protein
MLSELKNVLRGLLLAIRLHTLFTAGVTSIAIWLCAPHRLALSFDVPLSVLVFGIIFPLSHSICENFRRREHANALLSTTCATVTTLWTYRDWICRKGRTSEGEALIGQSAVVLSRFLRCLREQLDVDMSRPNPEHTLAVNRCLQTLSSLSRLNERLAASAGYQLGGQGGMGRITQLMHLLAAIPNQLADIQLYSGTPVGMRHFLALSVYVSPILLAPYWRSFCPGADAREGPTTTNDSCPGGYLSAGFFVVILSSLYSVTLGVENCFDGIGDDDVKFRADIVFEDVVKAEGPLPSGFVRAQRPPAGPETHVEAVPAEEVLDVQPEAVLGGGASPSGVQKRASAPVRATDGIV